MNKAPRPVDVPKPCALGMNINPTPQRNDPIIADSIFAVDTVVIPIDLRQSFTTSFAQLPNIARDMYDQMSTGEARMDKILAKEEIIYYSTGLLWLKLMDVKAKQQREALSSVEKDIHKVTAEKEWNVPQPLYAYLTQIGHVTDKIRKETELEVPALPVATAQGFGGYIAPTINEDNHNLFEEIPCLGIAADTVMTLTSNQDAPVTPVRIGLPVGASITNNLCRYTGAIRPHKLKIKQSVTGQGITATTFPEFSANTRFNYKYLCSISDTLLRFSTFRNEKVCFSRLTLAGGESQAIKTHPTDPTLTDLWTDTTILPISTSSYSAAQIGAARVFGFQLYKEGGPGANVTEQSRVWSCIAPTPGVAVPWVMTPEWSNSRNDRRNLPPGIGGLIASWRSLRDRTFPVSKS